MLLLRNIIAAAFLHQALTPYLAVWAQTVQIGNTTVIGTTFPEVQTEFFGGIPFASPPIGSLRFVPPVLQLSPNVSTLDASQFGPICPQLPSATSNTTQALPSSEDCLTINVLRPVGTTASSNLPVMVWVYGGGFTEGGSAMFNASAIIAQSVSRGTPVVYVNFNYRLGPLGYPVGDEAEARGALNLGDKDAIAALRWVQNNIGAFGGDKDKVTIFGESAGAILISQLLLNPDFNLARAAILESGSAATTSVFNASHGQSLWQQFVSLVTECDGASINDTFGCLRAASLDSIINAEQIVLAPVPTGFGFVPVIDGEGGVIPGLPSTILTSGNFAKIPFISGTNKDEGTIFTNVGVDSADNITMNVELTAGLAQVQEQTIIDEILQLYPNDPALGAPFGTGNETFGLNPEFKRVAAVQTDVAFAALRRNVSQLSSANGLPVFSYLFTDPQPSSGEPFLGTFHGSEIAYVYGAPLNGPASIILSETMIDYWVSFATSLTPNDGFGNLTRPEWEQYSVESPVLLDLNSAEIRMISDDFRQEKLAFINANPLAFSH